MARDYPDDGHTDGDSNHDASQGSSREDQPGFFDLEASEASSDFGSEGSLGFDDTTVLSSFPRFLELPIEIREMIWKSFCPDLDTCPRIFELDCFPELSGTLSLTFGAFVERQTLPTRIVLAVHRESRALGLRFSPHRLELPGDCGIMPYNMSRDIITFAGAIRRGSPGPVEALSLLAQVARDAQHVAFSANAILIYDTTDLVSRISVFPSLKNVFVFAEADALPTKALTWCVSEQTHEYRIETEEEQPGIGEDLQMTYCWPDPEAYDESGGREKFERRMGEVRLDEDGYMPEIGDPDGPEMVSLWVRALVDTRRALNLGPFSKGHSLESSPGASSSGSEDANDGNDRETECQKLRVWPMTRFMFDTGIQRLNDMRAWQQPWAEWESDCDSLDSYNEYESDGIDDDSIDEFIATDDEDDLPTQILDGSSQASDLPLDHNDLAPALFSSDSEAEDADDHDSDASQSDDDQDLRSRAARSHRRVIESDSDDQSATEAGSSRASAHRTHIVLSDSDENGDDEKDAAPKPARGTQRRTRPVAVDSEDEDEDEGAQETPRYANRPRARAIPVDSDDDTDGGDHPPPSRPANRRVGAALPISSEDEDGPSYDEQESGNSSDDEEEGVPPPKRLSLAKRLRMEYQQSRKVRHTDEDSDEETDNSEDSGAPSDDDEEEEDEDEDASDGDGMVMGMAEEGEDEDEEQDRRAW